MPVKTQSHDSDKPDETPPWETSKVALLKDEEGNIKPLMLLNKGKRPFVKRDVELSRFGKDFKCPSLERDVRNALSVRHPLIVANKEVAPTLQISMSTTSSSTNSLEIVGKSANDSFIFHPKKLTYTSYPASERRNIEGVRYAPTNDQYCQNLCPDLKSWLEAATPIPNSYVLFQDKVKHIKATKYSMRKRKAMGNPVRRRKGENITPWYRVCSKKHRTTPGWGGYRPPSVESLIQSQFNKGDMGFTPYENEYLIASLDFYSNKSSSKLSDNSVEISDFDFYTTTTKSIRPRTAEILCLPLKLRPHQHYKSSDPDYLKYTGWLFKEAQANSNKRVAPSRGDVLSHWLQYNSRDIARPLPEMCREEQMACNECYYKRLKKYDTLNRHVDYFPESVVIEGSDGGVLRLGKRFPPESGEPLRVGMLEKASSILPASRFSRNTMDTGVTTDESWLRYVPYLEAYLNDQISLDCLAGIGRFMFSDKFKKICNLYGYQPRILPKANREEEVKKVVGVVLDNSISRIESNRLESRVILDTAKHPSGHSQELIFSFVMRKGWEGFKQLSSGVLIPEDFDEKKGCVVIDNDTSTVLSEGWKASA